MSTSTATESTTPASSGTRTSAADKVWAALRANPGSTTEQLAAHASVGQSTAGKILAGWISDGSVTRTPTGRGKRSQPAHFTITETDGAQDTATSTEAPPDPADTDGKPDTAAADPLASDAPDPDASDSSDGERATTAALADPTDAPATATTKQPRLAAGGLRGMVEDFLRDHPDETFGPAAIGRTLGRSSGAVANALDRLVADGYAVMTSPKPKRYGHVARTETS